MPAKKTPGTARYRVTRDCAIPPVDAAGEGTTALAGELVDLDPETGALLTRDGMVTPAEEA